MTQSNVRLLAHTPNPEDLVALAAMLCYNPGSIDSIMAIQRSDDVKAAYIQRLIVSRHESVLEHACFTFSIDGVSRACSHQLVRSRIASFSQRSQRYVKEADFDYTTPASVEVAGSHAKTIYRDTMDILNERYQELLKLGVPAEDARMILPNACVTQLIVTMNARELLHVFRHRCCERAQWEYRGVATEMLRLAKHIAPNIFKQAGPSCVSDRCYEGNLSCGKQVEIKEKFLHI